jgi:plastocyanin
MVKRTLVALSLTALLALGLPGGARILAADAQQKPAANPEAKEVKIDNFVFQPATLKIAIGTTVTWVNHDDIPHTVVGTDKEKSFKSKVLDTDEKFSFAFTKAGKYPYFCSLHPKMTGEVLVQ